MPRKINVSSAVMTTLHSRGMPKRRLMPMAVPSTSARSQAEMAISVRSQRKNVTRRATGLFDLRCHLHAAAGVEQQRNAHRGLLGAKIGNRTALAPVEQLEIRPLQVLHDPTALVANDRAHRHQVDSATERRDVRLSRRRLRQRRVGAKEQRESDERAGEVTHLLPTTASLAPSTQSIYSKALIDIGAHGARQTVGLEYVIITLMLRKTGIGRVKSARWLRFLC